MNMKIKQLLLGVMGAMISVVSFADEVIYTGQFWKDDGFYGDDREPSASYAKTPDKAPHGHRLVYTFDVPETGWYAPFFKEDPGDQDFFVDGKCIAMARHCGRRGADGFSAGPSLYLEKGQHELCLERLGRRGFPFRKFTTMEIRRLEASPANWIFAEKEGHDVIRLGESVCFAVTAGLPEVATEYEFRVTPQNGPDAGKWTTLGTLAFPATKKPLRKTVALKLPKEDMYYVQAFLNGKALPTSAFPRFEVVAIDVANQGRETTTFDLETVVDIDCVSQEPDATANGPTQITKSGTLVYRESHDCSREPDGRPYDGNDSPNLSCFTYRVKVPEAQVPYVLEVTFPDDARRSVCVRHDWVKEGTKEYLRDNDGYQTKSYETGGFFPISGEMKKQVQIIWPLSAEGYVTFINQSAGTRAAAARIRISRFRDDLVPSQAATGSGGRTFAYWSEEGNNFSIMLGAKKRPFLEAANRWYQMIRFYGGNAMSGCGIAYQGASWEARAWKGIGYTHGFSSLRLFALLGEKYHMSFIPEWFGNQWFMDNVVYPKRAGGKENSQAKNASGGLAGGGVNALCPAVQDVILATMREIHDEIGDSPAFKGLTVRADGWLFRGEFFFKSIYWGYNEMNVRAFERETGVKVPAGSATDYFKFLTSPAMKDKWIAWRCAKIADYHERILKALRGETRKDLFFGIAGQFDQEGLYAKEKTYAARALGSGVDSVARRHSDGLSLIPCARFGWRTPTVEGRAIYDEYFQKESTDGGMGVPRAFASYMNYHELGTTWPIAKLGIDLKEKGGHPPYLCSASVAAGRASLEKYAVVLAEQDTSYFREGGNADSFGSADVMGPWLARYESLPAVAFDRVSGKNDPVAVWQKTVGDRLWYYAVNKESFATTATLTFSDGTTREITLEPWGLEVFNEVAGRTVTSAESVYPESARLRVRALLAHAQAIAPKVKDTEFDEALAAAWDAAESGHWWRARVTLNSAPMYAGYAANGGIPKDVLRTPFPDKLDTQSQKNGHWNLCTPSITATALQQTSDSKAKLVSSHTVNPDWRGEQVLWSESGELAFTLDVLAEGRYKLVLGAVSAQSGIAVVSANGTLLPEVCMFGESRMPMTASFGGIDLKLGKVEIRVKSSAPIGIYGIRFLPELRPIPGVDWAVAGPFERVFGGAAGWDDKLLKNGFDDLMKKDLDTLDWKYATPGVFDALSDRGVHMPLRISSTGCDRLIARTTVWSDRDRTATLVSAVDWWSRATLNGERVKTNVVGGSSEENDLDFWGWYPMFTGKLNLKKGANDLVFYVNGGSLGSAITGWITDDAGIRTTAPEKGPKTLVLTNDTLRAEIVPAWGGRLMFFGTATGVNALWTNPEAVTNTVDAKGRPVWKNVGGEKNWMGIESRWAGFSPDGKAWPPPAWFDSAPLDVVRANETNILLRSPSFHTSSNWTVALEREFTLEDDRLVVRQRAIPPPDATPESLIAVPDDTRRIWSVTQIPCVDKIAVRTVGEGRTKLYDGCPSLSATGTDGWATLDLTGVKKHARITMDADALASEIPGAGRLIIEQTAAPRHLATFKIPTRAIVFTTGTEAYNPSPYIELEFVAQGPDAEQTLTFRIEGAKEAEAAAKKEALARMREDSLGMFVHWGLYAIPAQGEWLMNRKNIPIAEYDKLINDFHPPATFSPREWVRLAKRAGCRYAVLTTRHHDGFCLFDTKTTDFNSVKSPAHRDFVREFVDACREEGLRVGLYYSIMNWQFDHSPNGVFDQAVWNEQVRTTHEALRELMTNYGKIDYLWYDGCSAPGSTDAEHMERMWRIRDLNAMARRLQPDILINDRSSVPGDFATPEQSLAAPPRGRPWESCMTCNGNWGYVKDDHNWKSGETLFRSLLHCARFGGNLLINIGPKADGSIPEESVRAFEELGRRVAACPESIYGAQRDDWTEATHEAGVVTKANGSYWLHTLKDEISSASVPRLDHATKMERVAPGVYRVAFEKGAKPCNWLGGRHDVEIKAGAAPVLGDVSDRESPPLGIVQPVDLPNATEARFELPTGGRWRLDVGYVTAEGFKDTLSVVRETDAAGVQSVALPAGARGIYALRQSPDWQATSPKAWSVAGTFPSRYYETAYDGKAAEEVFSRDLLVEAAKATFVPVGAANDKANKSDVRVNHNYSDPEKGIGYAFARLRVHSETARTVSAAVGVDWWAEVYVNGERVLPMRSGWKPAPFPLKLRAGENEILVITHGGSRQHWFTFFSNANLVR